MWFLGGVLENIELLNKFLFFRMLVVFFKVKLLFLNIIVRLFGDVYWFLEYKE